MELVYTTTNRVGVAMTYKRGTAQLSEKTLRDNIGTCAAQSCVWISNMQKGAPELSKPDQFRCALSFGKNWITKEGAEATYGNMRDAGLTEEAFRTFQSITMALIFAAGRDGYCLIELSEGHFIAAANIDSGFYLFDCNDGQGLWRSTNHQDFLNEGLKKLTDFGWTDNQEVWVSAIA